MTFFITIILMRPPLRRETGRWSRHCRLERTPNVKKNVKRLPALRRLLDIKAKPYFIQLLIRTNQDQGSDWNDGADMSQSDHFSPSCLGDGDLAPGDMRQPLLSVTYGFLLTFKTLTHTGQTEVAKFSFPAHFYQRKKGIKIF